MSLSVDRTAQIRGEALEFARTILYAVAIALVLRIFLFQPFNIPSGSMIPNLLEGDYLFVSKYAYGYSKHSFPFSAGPISDRVFSSAPKRGDVAVFKTPEDNRTDYIKRVIGLPGDRIQVVRGVLHINGEPIARERMEDYTYTDRYGNVRTAPRYRETLPNGVAYVTREELGDRGPSDNTSVYVVPQGHYFMMGDNRDNSTDSRVLSRVGYVPHQNLVGRAERLFFSVDGQRARLWQIWKWPFAIRYGRILQSVE
ncbi:MAG: signal peptidase I [Pseudomonadota bacterium]